MDKDKNKSRSDLLKAGRKKLQQFREKKDGKGGSSSHGKSSKKSSKSEQHQLDTDAASSAAKPTVSSLTEVEDVSNADSDLRDVDSDSMENSLVPDVASVDPSSVVITPEESIVDASLAYDAELPPLQSGVSDDDSTVPKNKESTQIVDAEESRAVPSATLGAPVLEGETKHADNSGITNLTASSASVDTAEEVAEMDTLNGKEREEVLPSQKVTPDASLIQSSGDQVTDVGKMQEADDLGLKKFDRSGEPELEGDGKLVLSDLGGSAATLREADATPATSHQVENQLKDAVVGFPDEEKSGIPFVIYGNDQKEGAQANAENKTVTEMHNQQYMPEDSLMTRGKAHEGSLETEMESSKGPVSNAELGNSGLILPDYCHPDLFERLKEELYLTNFGKDIFHLQLKEMSDMEMKFDHQQQRLVDEISLLRASLNEDQEKKEHLAEELAHCRSELQAAASKTGELENQVHSVKVEAHELSSRAHELQISLERSQRDSSNMSVELADCKGLVATLQVENEKLNGTLSSMTEDGKKLVEEKESCLHENEKLSLELADCKSIIASLQIENCNLSGTVTSVIEERKKLEEEKESHTCEYARISGELTDCKGLASVLQVENANINHSLSLITEERKKIEEDKEYFIRENERLSNELLVLQKKFPSDSEEHTRDGRISSLVLETPSSDDPQALVVLKAHLEEAEKILQNLEKAIEEMHSEAMSFSRSSGKMAAPGVSKLIQAFESKVQHDELEAEDKSLPEDQSPADPFKLIKEQTGKLRTVLQKLPLDAGESFNVAGTELKIENEALKKNCDNLEVTNIELGVLYEAVKQHACEVEAKNKEFEVQIEALKREDIILKAEYVELGEKVSGYKSRANELLSQLHDLQRSSDEKTSVMEYQLESLQKEATERALILEQEWESTIAQTSKTMGRLDECIARVSGSAISTRADDGLDVNSHIGASVNATIKVIEGLQEKKEAALEDLEAIHGSYKEVNEKLTDLIRKNESASVTLHQIYDDLRKLLIDSCGSVDEIDMNIQAGELVDPLDYANYKTFLEQLKNLVGERLQLQSLNRELNSELMNRTSDIEELNRRSLTLKVIQKLAEDVEGVVNLQNSETDSDLTPASHLESLVSLLVQKYNEASEEVSTSRNLFSNTIQKLIEDVDSVVNWENTDTDLDLTPALHLELLVSSLVQKYKDAIERVSLSREDFSNAIQKLVGDIEGVVILENTEADLDITPALHLELLVSSLVQKYKEASERVSSSTEEFSNTIQKLIGDIEGVVNLHASESNSDITPALRLELLVSLLVQKYKETSEQVSSSTEEFSNTVQKLIGDIDGVLKMEDTVTNSDITPALRLESLVSSLVQKYKEASEQVNSSTEELSTTIQKLIGDIEGVVNLGNTENNSDITPALHLESLVSSLVQKYKGVGERVCSSNEEFGSKAMEMKELQEKIQQLNAFKHKHENEILALKESLGQAEEALTVARSELQEKASELGQSDQRVSSVREKLGIAVGKGKALVVQRDNLKQSLAETSKELERCSQELQLKDARLHELETKLKTYTEAGERVESLESELSYIRNSATALRESFLLKDSVLQRIEEILEDLDLPEQFHSRGIIEKVDWLARSAAGNPLPVTEWDQKSSVGGSYSDAWKEDAPPSSSSGDDLRRNYEELQNKFYGLAEQTEMLEQSLMERNHMVQRWEELLDRINMPSHLRSVEPEGRIEWLGTALMEADHDRSFFLQKIDKLENYCGLVTADLEESQKRISELEGDLQAVIHEREHLSERLEILTSDQETILAKAVRFEHVNGKLQSEVTDLQEKLAEKVGNEERIQSIEVELHKLEGLVSDALQDPDAKELVSCECGTECLEALLRKLIKHYSALSMAKPVLGTAVDGIQTTEADANLDESGSRDIIITEKPDVAVLRKDLEEAMSNLMHVKEERDVYMEKQQSLICEVEALDRKREELQEQLIQEEQKSASLREKLNVAVRKGKSLVQQRDSLKQTLEELNNEVDRLKSEISHRENALADNEQKIRGLSAYPEMVEALESERVFLRDRLTETEHVLQEREHILNSTINALGDIDVGGEVTIDDPVEKLKHVGKLLHDLHASLASSEQESKKSRRAAELLLAELNEVQERNDYLQEELAKAGDELAETSREREVAEAAKFEALSRFEKLSTIYSEGKQKQYYELMVLKTSVKELKKGLSDVNSLLADVFSKDLEFLHNLEANMESFLKQRDTTDAVGMPILSAYSGITSSNSQNKQNLVSMDSWSGLDVPDHLDDSAIVEVCSFVEASLQELKTDVVALKDKLDKHPISLLERASNLSKVLEILLGEMNLQKKSFEALKRDFTHVESVEREKDMEIVVLRRNIALLYEACNNSIMDIINKKAELVGNNSVFGERGMSLNPVTSVDGDLPSGGQALFNSEEYIKAIADRLSSTLKDFAVTKSENVEGNLKEMKATIADLQRELQEKDIQKDRICSELVAQIKGAEAAAQSYLQDLQSEKSRVYDMEQQLKVMEEERSLLEQRLKELQDDQATLTELQDRVKSLSDVLPAKDQEIEALMQALDEEEIQMDELKNRIKGLEKVLQQKNIDLQNLEASRGKIAKRLSVTVNKFDELHHLSESLLAEVEKLQSQLQDRDAEISFLRQEVTRCTNEVLVASQTSKKRDSDEIQEILSWVDTIISQTGVHDLHLDDKESSQVQCRELLEKKISAIISEFVDQRVAAQSRDAMLQVERGKVQELTHREEVLRKSLREMESQINMLEDVGDSGRENSLTSEILEVEPLMNKWTVPGPSTTSQVRSLRKVNNDQVAIAIDTEHDSSRLEDEDDDKVHGFKSLTASRVVPRFTRPVTDMIDGLWVSCDRALMRQPALRLTALVPRLG
ncbi:hypothetical protein LWI28_021802 [Acer negundo]|uniref:Uncharacterized protein n=1 Tax=Acer negundo TaxID=4023 RepID=A0AAD5JHA0_ACENE|nr:hypothetical protein LWI28_021802 [Acer negundo]